MSKIKSEWLARALQQQYALGWAHAKAPFATLDEIRKHEWEVKEKTTRHFRKIARELLDANSET